MRIGILPNINKEKALKAASEIASVEYEDTEIIISDDAQKYLTGQFSFGDIKTCDIIVALGGDGTLLKAARQCAPYDIPILGINLGNLGFLTEVSENHIKDAVKRIIAGDFSIEERMMLEVRLMKDDNQVQKHFALNDAVLARTALSRMTQVKVSVNGMHLGDYYADGIIISTPTGSTGYSLSAGGPIIEPEMKLMTITPICPHTLNSRPVIISDDKVITLVPSIQKESQTALTIDGQIHEDIQGNVRIEVARAGFTAKLVKFGLSNYYKTIREKLFKM